MLTKEEKLFELYKQNRETLLTEFVEVLSNTFLGEKFPIDIIQSETGEILILANRQITKSMLRKAAAHFDKVDMDPSPIKNKWDHIASPFCQKLKILQGD